MIYADDTDFVSTSAQWLESLEPVINDTLKKWNLTVNKDKTERTNVSRSVDRVAET